MAAAKGTSRKRQPAAETKPESAQAEKKYILATGLEDYGRWKTMFKDQTGENDPPFRRGRIWA